MRLILIALLLSACTPTTLKGSGEATPAPWGYTKLCIEHPEQEACKK